MVIPNSIKKEKERKDINKYILFQIFNSKHKVTIYYHIKNSDSNIKASFF